MRPAGEIQEAEKLSDMPGVPKDVQRWAAEYADELWTSLENDVLRSDANPAELERIKPKVIHALRLAFIRGTLTSIKAGFEALEKAAKRQRPKGMN